MPFSQSQQQIIDRFDTTVDHTRWHDWKWQMRHCIRDIETFEKLLAYSFPEKQRNDIERTIKKFPMSITPYYLSLIQSDSTDSIENDPIFKQAFPSVKELDIMDCDMEDPLHEDVDSPVPGLTHRYPDRVLFLVSNTCAMYCRHCTRKRKVGDIESIPDRERIEQGIQYIAEHPIVRDVLLSGGDPLLLSDEYLDWILTELRKIKHVEIIRIGTRVPVVLPYRITDELIAMLKKHHPLFLNTQFNHPREMTDSSRKALEKLANAGIPLGNQSVLLNEVNDCPRIMKSLVHKLVQNRVRPYYMYQCDLSEGLSHFRTSVGKGIEIMESLQGHTSGLCVPTYVIDAPGGGGKIPVMPNYLISWSSNKVILRNYEGVITTYQEPSSYVPTTCDRNCEKCNLELKLQEADEYKAIGIEKLLCDYEKNYSMTPSCHEKATKTSQVKEAVNV
ncbi:lysine-2,3-aminomutase [Sphaerochaeta pleomorpha str. Grapes]|uniref:L-lysine 2,3-aminomutase n=1 Tax=Sphaerochaeta pleomorpha (strain ATCC BAA-1885 / DSM 22778 / Grapes) TaxID=158190 RepID=G8QT56_SPHPG|nr:lysine 2,3-aminomutase [Sphaerochaeta pleomorpha]AEV27961.1 lysine-2,3-aminomutase [Sphaerochaeta pleomorpha str. Grapes]